MSIIPFVVAAFVLLCLAAYLLAAGVMLIIGGARFGAAGGVLLGIIFLLAGGWIGHMGVEVAPINISIERNK